MSNIIKCDFFEAQSLLLLCTYCDKNDNVKLDRCADASVGVRERASASRGAHHGDAGQSESTVRHVVDAGRHGAFARASGHQRLQTHQGTRRWLVVSDYYVSIMLVYYLELDWHLMFFIMISLDICWKSSINAWL